MWLVSGGGAASRFVVREVTGMHGGGEWGGEQRPRARERERSEGLLDSDRLVVMS